MVLKSFTSYCFILLFIIASGCQQSSTKKTDIAEGNDVLISYADGFGINHLPDYTTVTIYNPWKPGEIYDRYYLVKDQQTVVPTDGQKVHIPLKSLMVNSATHLGFLELLGEIDKVNGVSGSNYIYNPTVRAKVADGSIPDLGDSFNMDMERLLILSPQAIMTSAYNAEDENSKRLKQTGLTIIYNIEWQEKKLLGRAEWIKFIGAFFDKNELADSIFNDVVVKYNAVKNRVKNVEDLPSVLSGQDFRGSWSMPGGQSFNAELFRDAKASYFYANDLSTGSISSTIEEALVHFSNADFWVGVQMNTLKELELTDSKYKLFQAFQEGNVYNTFQRTNPTGGNDYWESGVARPDLLLSDMIKIFHPDLMRDYEFTYMKRLTAE